MTGHDHEELRALIREVIRDVLPELGIVPAPQTVEVSNDEQLGAFVTRLTAMLDDPTTGPLVRSGQLSFRLKAESPPVSEATPASGGGKVDDVEIDSGALTERIVERAISDGARLVLGRGVVITPLARERIRKSAVTVVQRT
ncbi:MAG: hypothetical protein WBQ44_12580 [Rhodococcus sp. (in: high G+C Gram-positive bacteria)]